MISTFRLSLRLLYVGQIIVDKSRKKISDAFVDQARGRELGFSRKRSPHSYRSDGIHWLRSNSCGEMEG